MTSALAATGVRQSPAVPSRAGSAGVILRGWELIAAWVPPEAGAASQIPADCNPEVYDEGFWSRVDAWVGQSGLTGPTGIVQASEVPGAG